MKKNYLVILYLCSSIQGLGRWTCWKVLVLIKKNHGHETHMLLYIFNTNCWHITYKISSTLKKLIVWRCGDIMIKGNGIIEQGSNSDHNSLGSFCIEILGKGINLAILLSDVFTYCFTCSICQIILRQEMGTNK